MRRQRDLSTAKELLLAETTLQNIEAEMNHASMPPEAKPQT